MPWVYRFLCVVLVGVIPCCQDGCGNVPQYSVETIEAMQKHILGYRDNLRVEVEVRIRILARTMAELRALSTWPGRLFLDIHIDLDPRLA